MQTGHRRVICEAGMVGQHLRMTEAWQERGHMLGR